MKKLFLVSLMVILVAAMILGGCAKETPSTTTTTPQTQTSTSATTPTPEPNKVLKIGSVLALNNPLFLGQKKWYDLFVKLKNEQGGWKIGADTYTVDMIIYDSEGDLVKARNYLEKLVLQDGVKFILSTPTYNPATDAKVTEPNKVICFGADPTGTSTDPKIQYYYTPPGPFFRGFMWGFYHQMELEGMKSYVQLNTDDQMGHVIVGWSNSTWASAAPSVKNAGDVFFAPATSDFGPVATKIMSLHPDVLDCSSMATTSQLYNALYDAGFKGTILPGPIPEDQLPAIIAHCGKQFVEGWKLEASDPRLFPNQDPAMLALADAYVKEYGTFQSTGVTGTCFWFVLKDAIDNTQSVDVETIKAYLDNQPHAVRNMTGYSQLFARPDAGNLRTITGEPAIALAIVKDGKVEPYMMVAVKDQYLGSIMSYGLLDVYKAYWEKYGYPKFPADQTSFIKFSDLGITGHD